MLPHPPQDTNRSCFSRLKKKSGVCFQMLFEKKNKKKKEKGGGGGHLKTRIYSSFQHATVFRDRRAASGF